MVRVGRCSLAVSAALLLGSTGCQMDKTMSPAASAAHVGSADTSPWYDVAQMQNIDRVAQLLAEGLGDGNARAALHAALRESPWTEHKVILSEFLDSPRGRRVVESAATRSGTTAATIDQLVASLPPVDLYVPARQHRRSWRASDQIAVVALVDLNSPLTAFLPGHAHLDVNRWSAAVPATPLLMLGPAELKLIRADAGIAVASSTVIESDGAAVQGPAFMMCLDCGGGGGGGGGWTPPPPPNPDLRIVTIATSNIVDNNNPFESNEFEFRATASNGATQSPVVRCTGIPSTGVVNALYYCTTTVVHNLAPTEVGYVDVDVVETDGWLQGDDRFRDYLTNPPGAQLPRVTAYGPHSFILYEYPQGSECLPPNPFGNPFCPYVTATFGW
jgi:hypothetical protein